MNVSEFFLIYSSGRWYCASSSNMYIEYCLAVELGLEVTSWCSYSKSTCCSSTNLKILQISSAFFFKIYRLWLLKLIDAQSRFLISFSYSFVRFI